MRDLEISHAQASGAAREEETVDEAAVQRRANAASRSAARVQFKGTDGAEAGTLEAGAAEEAVETAKADGDGAPLDDGVRDRMEGAFGAELGDVRVHQGGAAEAAAGDLNARAFTAGNDIFFGADQYDPESERGEHLLAHELAHVVQQGSGAKGTGEGATVSSSGDAAEVEADRAADAVVAGQPVGPLGAGPASSVIHRDAIGDIDSISRGNWVGDVDEGGALKKIAALTPPQRQRLINEKATMRRLVGAFDSGEMVRMFRLIPELNLAWRIYWLVESDCKPNEGQWLQIIGFSTPADWDNLRASSSQYNFVLQKAPDRLIPAWDRLVGLKAGTWSHNAQAVRNAVEALNPNQKQQALADDAMMTAIMKDAGNTKEKFRVIMQLDPPMQFKVYWLKVGNALKGLEDRQWAELLAGGTKGEYDALAKWSGWADVEKHCPAHIISITRTNSDVATAASNMNDPVQVNAIFSSLGPAGFIIEAAKGEPDDVKANYKVIRDDCKKVTPTVDGLAEGPQMSNDVREALRKWFFLETDVPILEKMVAKRFAVDTTGKGSMSHESGKDPATLAPWTFDSIRQCWIVMERLPPEQVTQNKKFMHLLRNSAKGNGEAYFWGKDVVMGVSSTDNIAGDTVPTDQLVYQAGGQAPGSAAVNVNYFNATLRHEIGHAVDRDLGIMDRMRETQQCGNWVKYGSYDSFVDAIIRQFPTGMSGHGYPDEGKYKKAMRRAVSKHKTFTDALKDVDSSLAAVQAGPVAVVWEPRNWDAKPQPWYSDKWVTAGTRNFQCAYGDDDSLWSFDASHMSRTRVTEYQWRAPGEWFAECYQVYYAEQEQNSADAPDPNLAVGGILRSKDKDAAALISSIADRGYSPQDMRGGTVAKAPGT
jgi:hypothetical protein